MKRNYRKAQILHPEEEREEEKDREGKRVIEILKTKEQWGNAFKMVGLLCVTAITIVGLSTGILGFFSLCLIVIIILYFTHL
jgi:hypothetical protein